MTCNIHQLEMKLFLFQFLLMICVLDAGVVLNQIRHMTPGSDLPFQRSLYADGSPSAAPRVAVNDVTSFVDGSTVYGSNEITATALRSGKFSFYNITYLAKEWMAR